MSSAVLHQIPSSGPAHPIHPTSLGSQASQAAVLVLSDFRCTHGAELRSKTKALKPACRHAKQDRIQRILNEAEQAAQKGLTAVYQVVRKLAGSSTLYRAGGHQIKRLLPSAVYV